jgi:hypothetical protein
MLHMMDDETSRNSTRNREPPKMSVKDNAIIFITIIGSFILFMILDLQLSLVVLKAMKVQISFGTNLVILLFIMIETYIVYRVIKWILITNKNKIPSDLALDLHKKMM